MDVRQLFNVHVGGAGRQPMLFVHGFGCDQNIWRLVAPAFESDYRVVLMDLPGAGKADPSAYDRARHSTLAGYAQDVITICDALDLREVIYVGHSVSTMIGLLAAVARPDRFARLILIGPSPRYLNEGDYVGGFTRKDIDGLLEQLDSNYLGWASTLAPVIVGPDRPDFASEWKNSVCRSDPEITRRFARVTFLSDNRSDLERVRTPALIVQVQHDAIAPPAVGDYVHRHLARSELTLLEDRGHCPHLTAPEQTIAAMRAYLRSDRA